jgi:hypothetical protein
MRPTVFLAALAIAAACTSATTATDATGGDAAEQVGGKLDDTLNIRLGETRAADGTRISVRFDSRISDSRCPANAVCVWQGDAHVKLTVSVGGQARTAELHTGIEPRRIVVDRYTLSLVGMTPYPGSGDQSATPTAIVRVERD